MKRSQGFLLVEVILTLGLLAAGLLTVTASFNVSKKMMNRSREFFRSTLVLQEKMFDLFEKEQIDPSDRPSSEGWDVQILPVAQSEDILWVKTAAKSSDGTELGPPFETYVWKKK